MQMQLSRDHVYVARNGISIEFKAGVPSYVHPRHVQDVVALGAVAAPEDEATVEAEMKVVNAAKIAADERLPQIKAAITTLIQRNQRGDFTAGGSPNLAAMFRLLGYSVTKDEIDKPFNEIKAALA